MERRSDSGQAIAEYAIICGAVLVLVLGLLSLIQGLEKGEAQASMTDAGMSHTVTSFGDAAKDVLLY